jgi:hypothetical protein
MPYVTRYNEFTNSDEVVWVPETTSPSFSTMPEFLPGGGGMPFAAGPFTGGVTTGRGNQEMYEDFGMPGTMPQLTQRTDSFIAEDEAERARFAERAREEREAKKREQELNRDIRVKIFDWDSIPGSRTTDPDYPQRGTWNKYEELFNDDSLYRGQWKSFEDVLRNELAEEIPREWTFVTPDGDTGVRIPLVPSNRKHAALIELREWYNKERSINQRRRTEEKWEKAGLPVGDFGVNGRYEITQEDWEDSDIGKKYLKDNPPANPEYGYSVTELENIKDAFNNFNSQWTQNFSKGNPISNLDFFVSGEDTEVVEDDRAGIDDAFGDAFDVDRDDGEVIIPEPEGIREGDARQNYISDFLAGQIPDWEWLATVGPDEMSDEAKRELAEASWRDATDETKSKYGVVGPSPEPVVTTEGTGEPKILTDTSAKINAFRTLANYANLTLPSVLKMSVDGTLPPIPPALLEELKRPLIRIKQAGKDAFDNPITIDVDIPNPNIEPLFNIYRTQLDATVEAFRLAKQKDISDADNAARFNQALISATGGLAGRGTETDFDPAALAAHEQAMARIAATGGLSGIEEGGLTPGALRDFQREQALIGATGGLSGREGGLTPEALAQQELQRQQISATGGLSGLTPFSGAPTASEAARIQQQLFGADPARAISTARSLTPFEMAQLQLQPLRMQQAQEQARREEEQRQFNEQLAINQRAQELAELESQRRLGLQAGQLQQQRQLELARLFSDPTAVGSLSAIYGPQFFEQEQVFGSPFAGQTGAVQPLPVQNQQQPSFTPATNVSTPFGSSLTTGQFQEMSPYAQSQYLTTQARQKGKSRQELEREMEAVTPFGTPTGRGGLDKYFSGTGEL